jgi:outer membrane immunogenic protein
MKKLLLISTFTALIAGPATAADLARPVYRRPVVVAAPVYTWTGFYVGGNVGYSWGNARTDLAASGSTATFVNNPPGFPGFPSTVGFVDTNTGRLTGSIGGVQAGYNFQFNPQWVLGVEADIQGSGERGSGTFVDSFSTLVCFIATGPTTCPPTAPLNGTAATGYEARIGWFGTVRGRLGVLITDHVLLYGTGGLAYGQVKLSGNSTVTGAIMPTPGVVLPFTPAATAFDVSKTKVGFSVGGGLEGKCPHWLSANWTWKLEYLYLDLGSLDTVSSFVAPSVAVAPLTGSISTHTHFTDNIVRVGLNYKLDYAAAPVYK